MALCLVATQGKADLSTRHDPRKITDLSYGIFCERPPTKASTDEDTIKGSVERYSSNPVLWQKTQAIPAVDGLLFGVLGRETTDTDAAVTIVVDHPPLGTHGNTRESWETDMHRDHITFHGYYFGLSDGSPVGNWTITAIRGGQELFVVEFEVVKATRSDRKNYANCANKVVS